MVDKPKPLSKKKNKSIDLDPVMTSPDPIMESHISNSECDWLILHGLGSQNQMAYTRRAIQDPKASVNNPVYRPFVGAVADQIFNIIWNDNQMYQRLKVLLQNKHGLAEDDDSEDQDPDDKENEKNDDDEDNSEDDKNESVSFSRITSMLRKG